MNSVKEHQSNLKQMNTVWKTKKEICHLYFHMYRFKKCYSLLIGPHTSEINDCHKFKAMLRQQT